MNAQELNKAIVKRYPFIKVSSKPINIEIKDTQKAIDFSKNNIKKLPTADKLTVDYHRAPLRIGAFEVFITLGAII